ncbi:ABC transporter permease subunit [Sporosarcina sp. Marseille-Q4063]|uniref:ABC transporter permease n=1 Tax=Sporosarcina sp. Marseille-Q4063 TaxID=2810514 RepID=UPI001BAF7078|nr:ABC transporter permease subunit [Sporosarcina sp. Marseille-Q4063]QUW20821.1 ABC transporter permease subunit [Sporosarcina sp. Marseille-Q4063]
MTGFLTLLQKEWKEQTRNFKVLWIPLVFIIFGIIEPITNHYLPEIMKSVGNMPEGSEFLWPEYSGEEIFMSLLGQYQFIGILVIVLAFMGAISGERKTGTATLLYVRPISFRAYFLSKWVVINGIVLASVWLGFFAAWYYISILFNSVNAGEVIRFIAVYSLWIIFVVTVVLAFSATFSTGVAATLSLLLTIVFQLVDSLIGAYWTISPWKLPQYASEVFVGSTDTAGFWWSICVAAIAVLILIFIGVMMSKRNSAKTTV